MEPSSNLSEIQDNLQKQKIEGYSEYSNNLNDLNSKQFSNFLVTCSQIKPHKKDLKNFVRDGIKPLFVIKNIIDFFTKEGDSVLDVFSGTGEHLKLLSEMDRESEGLEGDFTKVFSYKRDVSSDSFLTESHVYVGDALEKSIEIKNLYNLIIVDPPILSKEIKNSSNISFFSVEDYVSYLKNLLDSLSKNIAKGGHLVLLIQDFYHKGTYHPLPFLISSKLSNLRLRGIKIYSRAVDTNLIPNKKVYAPVQNHLYALIFTI